MLYMIFKDGFEETEAIGTWDFIKRSGLEIITLSDSGEVTGTHGLKIKTDKTLDEAVTDGLMGVILPGGQPGSDNLFKCEKTKKLIYYAYENKLMLGAICAAPYILGEAGFLNGKRATCFPGFEDHLKGAEYTASLVERDGNIITAKGMGASFDFGFKIVEYFKGTDMALKIKEGIFAK